MSLLGLPLGCGSHQPSTISDPTYQQGGSCGASLGSGNPARFEVHAIEQTSPELAFPPAIAKVQDLLYIARSHQSFSVVDISDPLVPRSIGDMDLPYEVHSILVREKVAVIFAKGKTPADSASTLLITIDLEDPQNPKEIARQQRPGRLSAIQEREASVFVNFAEHESCQDCPQTRGQRLIELAWTPKRGLVQKQAWFVPLSADMQVQDGLTLSDSHAAFVSASSPTQALKSQVHLISRAPSATADAAITSLTFDGWIEENWQTRLQGAQLVVQTFERGSPHSNSYQDSKDTDDIADTEHDDSPHDLREDCKTLVIRSFDLSSPGRPRETYAKALDAARLSQGTWSPQATYGDDKALIFWPPSKGLRVLDLQEPQSPKLSEKIHVQAQGHWIQDCEIRGDEALIFGFDRSGSPTSHQDGHFVAKLLDLSDPMQPKVVNKAEFGSYELSHSAHHQSWFPSMWRHEDLVFANLGYNDDTFGPTDPYCEPEHRGQLQVLEWTQGQLKQRGRTALPKAKRHQLVHQGTLINFNGDRLTSVNLANLDAPSVEHDLLLGRSSDAVHHFDEAHWLVSHHDTWRNELVVQLISKDPTREDILAEHVIPGSPGAKCMKSPYVVDVFSRGKTAHLWVEGFEDAANTLASAQSKTQWRSADDERPPLVALLSPQARLITVDFEDFSHPKERSSLPVPALRTPMGSPTRTGTLRGHTFGSSDLLALGDALLIRSRTTKKVGEKFQTFAQDWQIDLRQATPAMRPLGETQAVRYAGGFTPFNLRGATSWEASPEGEHDARDLNVQMQHYQLNEAGELIRQTQQVSGIPLTSAANWQQAHLVNYRYEPIANADQDLSFAPRYRDPDDSTKVYRLITEVLNSNLAYQSPRLQESTILTSGRFYQLKTLLGLSTGFFANTHEFNPDTNRSSSAWNYWMSQAESPDTLTLAHALDNIKRLSPSKFLFKFMNIGKNVELDTKIAIVEFQGSQGPQVMNYRVPEGTQCNTPTVLGATLVCATGSAGIQLFQPTAP